MLIQGLGKCDDSASEKILECKCNGIRELANVTGEFDDEFYVPDFDYKKNNVSAIQIKCELSMSPIINLEGVLNAPRTFYLQKFCTINIKSNNSGGSTGPIIIEKSKQIDKKSSETRQEFRPRDGIKLIITTNTTLEEVVPTINPYDILVKMVKSRGNTSLPEPETDEERKARENVRWKKRLEILRKMPKLHSPENYGQRFSTVANHTIIKVEENNVTRLHYEIIIATGIAILVIIIVLIYIIYQYKCGDRTSHRNINPEEDDHENVALQEVE